MQNLIARGLPAAGVFVGPAAWLVSTQANYALAPWTCTHGLRAVPFVSIPLFALSLAGAFLSWRAFGHASRTGDERTVPAPDGARAASLDSPEGGTPHRLIAAIGVWVALLFALVIAVHGVAGLVFDGCER
jgi:hypothetical protein